MSSKSMLKTVSYTVSKFVHFLRHSVEFSQLNVSRAQPIFWDIKELVNCSAKLRSQTESDLQHRHYSTSESILF